MLMNFGWNPNIWRDIVIMIHNMICVRWKSLQIQCRISIHCSLILFVGLVGYVSSIFAINPYLDL